tara:strand:- start:362 stop:1294 length:933 start_codon:yes stop_codon:yes gene_type:complete
MFWQIFLLPKNNFLKKCNALYVPSGICLFSPLPKILFFQNLIPFQWEHLKKYKFSKTFFRLIIIRFFQVFSSHFASSIIFPSKFSLNIISNSFFFNSKVPISTIYHGVEKKFYFTPYPQKSIKYFSKDQPFIISYISIIDVYKNHLNVFKAVQKIINKKKLPINLQFIGSSNSKYAKNILFQILQNKDVKSWFSYIPEIRHDLLPNIYRNSNLLINASSCESFGMGGLESILSGQPVLASNSTVYQEILGRGALYFNELDVNDIYHSILDFIDSVEKRNRVIKKASKKEREFSWQKCSSKTFKEIRNSVN